MTITCQNAVYINKLKILFNNKCILTVNECHPPVSQLGFNGDLKRQLQHETGIWDLPSCTFESSVVYKVTALRCLWNGTPAIKSSVWSG